MSEFLIPNAYAAMFYHIDENFDLEKPLLFVDMNIFEKRLMNNVATKATKKTAFEIMLDLKFSLGLAPMSPILQQLPLSTIWNLLGPMCGCVALNALAPLSDKTAKEIVAPVQICRLLCTILELYKESQIAMRAMALPYWHIFELNKEEKQLLGYEIPVIEMTDKELLSTMSQKNALIRQDRLRKCLQGIFEWLHEKWCTPLQQRDDSVAFAEFMYKFQEHHELQLDRLTEDGSKNPDLTSAIIQAIDEQHTVFMDAAFREIYNFFA